ncbi:MAG: ATP--guanido phosphotransferase [Clostridia bacterium]
MWYNEISKDSDVVISSRVRFARNIDGFKFPHIMNELEYAQVMDIVNKSINKNQYTLFKMKDIDEITQLSLFEQHVISKEHIANNAGAIVTNEDNTIVTMVNEEDHLRIQAFESGMNLESCYKKISEFTNDLNKKIKFAINDKYGYITACPTNIGSGMRVSVLLHLPAIYKVGLISSLFNQITSIGISIRGLYGENTSAQGYMYQLSNQKTLGISDVDIISNMEIIITSVVEQERKARELLQKTNIELEDDIFRAYATLKNARIMNDEEARILLSKVRLGCAMDLIKDVELKKVQSLMVDIEPNTLKLILKENVSKDEEHVKRANYLRKEFC